MYVFPLWGCSFFIITGCSVFFAHRRKFSASRRILQSRYRGQPTKLGPNMLTLRKRRYNYIWYIIWKHGDPVEYAFVVFPADWPSSQLDLQPSTVWFRIGSKGETSTSLCVQRREVKISPHISDLLGILFTDLKHHPHLFYRKTALLCSGPGSGQILYEPDANDDYDEEDPDDDLDV